jgi:hypothetical protein
LCEIKAFSLPKKYNPIYNLRTMYPCQEIVKLRTMKNRNNENDNKDARELSTDAQGNFYEIHVKGHLDESWSDWLEGLEIKILDKGETALCGPVRDQAALMGILNRLYSLNLALVSMSEVNQHPRGQSKSGNV